MNPPITIAKLSYGGYATAVATLRTALWAGQRDSADDYFDCFTAEIKEQFRNARAKEAERTKSGTTPPRCSCGSPGEQRWGARVYAQRMVSDNEVELEYELYAASGENHRCRQPFRRIGEAWKISGPPQELR
jgi:hypothetical protein